MKTQKGITLVALIITIIVLLILAVIAINAVTGDGIINHAVNSKTEYETAAEDENKMLQNYLGFIDEKTPGIKWKKTSDGELAVGSTVKTNTNEEFYVIGFEDNNETVILLAKNNLKADGTAQDPTGAVNPCAFSASGNFEAAEDLNKNSTVKADTTSAVYKAIKYGETLGVTTGRLMLYSEIEPLTPMDKCDILFGKGGKSSGEHLNYWLGIAENASYVYVVTGQHNGSGYTSYDFADEIRGSSCYRNSNFEYKVM